MLLSCPMEMYSIAQITMAATLLKFGFSALAGAVVIAAIAGWILSAIRQRCSGSLAP